MALASALLNAPARDWLAEADPRLKLATLGWFSTLSVLVDSTSALASLFVLAALLASGLRLAPRGWLILAGLLAVVAWGTLVGQALFYAESPRTLLLTLIPPGHVAGRPFPGLRLYHEGALHGLTQSLRMLTMILAGLAVSLSSSPERLLAALARLRLNTGLGFVAVTALRFVPVLATEWTLVRQARRLRGYRIRWSRPGPWCRNWRQAAGLELGVLVPVLAAALRRTTALATSVTARGFDPDARRTYYPPLRFRSSERMLLAALIVSGLALVAAKSLYWLYLGEFYYHPALRNLYDLVRVWL